ncbi:hypothetical protein RvY_02870 [Ramazzottius varieornatus]|uniref:Tyr recombinase domain-containing protein n=1 Tax=Ramazzottius varieornatus TaxID=947166 RepID=A0A1D1UL57_RAMVA|nr:hypothetical protein RvY_02870 [Ramazzottius varieornatus]
MLLKGLTNQTRPDAYKRKLLTIEHLRQLKADLFGSLIPRHDQLMLWSAFTMAFYGMLRVSEYTSSKETSIDKSNLVLNDLQISCDSVQICLRRDKTHRKTAPPAIYLTKTQTDTCPVQALHAYMLVRSSARHTPLFIFHDGCSLTRQRVNRELQSFLGNGFTSHSSRIGAASTASKAGCSMEQIRAMGRWSSDVSNRYVRPDMVSLTQTMQRISVLPTLRLRSVFGGWAKAGKMVYTIVYVCPPWQFTLIDPDHRFVHKKFQVDIQSTHVLIERLRNIF